MSGIADDEYQRLVSRFWHNYLSLLEIFLIPIKARAWYRRHTEEYISVHQGVKLQHHFPQHIDEYLSAKDRITTHPEWRPLMQRTQNLVKASAISTWFRAAQEEGSNGD